MLFPAQITSPKMLYKVMLRAAATSEVVPTSNGRKYMADEIRKQFRKPNANDEELSISLMVCPFKRPEEPETDLSSLSFFFFFAAVTRHS